MTRFSFAIVAAFLAFGRAAIASEPTTATYLVTGLHCTACTKTVETSLRNVKGIRSVKVDWKSKKVRLKFDEAVVPAQKVAQLIANTPHMMGGDMEYGGSLALKVPDLKDGASGKQVEGVLGKLSGVSGVVAYPKQHSVRIEFGAKGDLTSHQLIDALGNAGIKAENF